MGHRYIFIPALLGAVAISSLFGCSRDPSPPARVPCANVASLQWMKVSSTYSSDNVAKLAANFKVAAEGDAEQLKLIKSATADVSVAPEFSHVSHKTNDVSAEVSQDFFQTATQYAMATCNAQNLLSLPGGLSASQRDEVVNTLITLSKNFGGISEKEKKN
jgi:hypothetical protein